MKKSTLQDDTMARMEHDMARMEHDMAHLAWRVARIERVEHDMQRMAYYDVMERAIERRRRKQASKRASGDGERRKKT